MIFYQAKTIVTVGILALLVVLETVAPEFVGRRWSERVKHDLVNAFFGVFNALLTSLLVAALTKFVISWATRNRFGLLNGFAIPAWLHWGLAIVLFDFWQYVWHWMNHRIPFFWAFHRVHHTDDALDVTSAFRFHPGEIIFSSLFRLGIMPLLGMTFHQLILYEVILLPIIMFHHSNVRVPGNVDRCFRWLIVTPWMHWVHHSNVRNETDSNYASIFSFWDRIFKTFRLREDPSMIVLGLKGVERRKAQGLWGMMVHPFRIE